MRAAASLWGCLPAWRRAGPLFAPLTNRYSHRQRKARAPPTPSSAPRLFINQTGGGPAARRQTRLTAKEKKDMGGKKRTNMEAEMQQTAACSHASESRGPPLPPPLALRAVRECSLNNTPLRARLRLFAQRSLAALAPLARTQLSPKHLPRQRPADRPAGWLAGWPGLGQPRAWWARRCA